MILAIISSLSHLNSLRWSDYKILPPQCRIKMLLLQQTINGKVCLLYRIEWSQDKSTSKPNCNTVISLTHARMAAQAELYQACASPVKPRNTRPINCSLWCVPALWVFCVPSLFFLQAHSCGNENAAFCALNERVNDRGCYQRAADILWSARCAVW